MKILVTGGEGFIGSWIVEKLCELKHQVITLDNHDTYGLINDNDLQKLYKWRKRNWPPQVHSYKGSVTDRDKVLTVFQNKPDVVIHLASYPRAKIVHSNPKLGIDNIIGGTLNLLEHCKNFGTKRFVFVSSSMIYGHFESGVKEGDEVMLPAYGQGQEIKVGKEKYMLYRESELLAVLVENIQMELPLD